MPTPFVTNIDLRSMAVCIPAFFAASFVPAHACRLRTVFVMNTFIIKLLSQRSDRSCGMNVISFFRLFKLLSEYRDGNSNKDGNYRHHYEKLCKSEAFSFPVHHFSSNIKIPSWSLYHQTEKQGALTSFVVCRIQNVVQDASFAPHFS